MSIFHIAEISRDTSIADSWAFTPRPYLTMDNLIKLLESIIILEQTIVE